LTSWPPRDRRTRVLAAVAPWFNPSRWSPYDKIIALAAVVLAVSVFLPWFKAGIRISGSSGAYYGTMFMPGPINGITVHHYLWAAFAVAVLQFTVLAARYFPSPRSLRPSLYRQLMIIASGLSFVIVLAGLIMRPASWFGSINLGDGFALVIGWDYGALVAVGAAIISLAAAVSALRDDPRR
jgi:hypothetical protein